MVPRWLVVAEIQVQTPPEGNKFLSVSCIVARVVYYKAYMVIGIPTVTVYDIYSPLGIILGTRTPPITTGKATRINGLAS